MVQLLLVSLAFSLAAKPTVSLDQSCRAAGAVAVVEATDNMGEYRLIEILYAGRGYELKKGTEVAVDLKGLVYDKGRAYILFLENAEKGKGYQAVPQMRTEDSKETRERVLKQLRSIGKI